MFLVVICSISTVCGESNKDDDSEKQIVATLKEIEQDMVKVQGHCFRMGDITAAKADRESPVHNVCLSDYFIGKYEVTQRLWQKIMGNNPSYFKKCGDDCPVEQVSWNDVQKFIRSLNSLTGGNFRLPTEAEWEYACRSGNMWEKYCGGDKADEVAWYADNSSGKTHPVGQKQPNSLGIYDMNGNVSEWVHDHFGDYPSDSQQDPQGPTSASQFLDRGGGWRSSDRFVDAGRRGSHVPGARDNDLGFRIASPAH